MHFLGHTTIYHAPNSKPRQIPYCTSELDVRNVVGSNCTNVVANDLLNVDITVQLL